MNLNALERDLNIEDVYIGKRSVSKRDEKTYERGIYKDIFRDTRLCLYKRNLDTYKIDQNKKM